MMILDISKIYQNDNTFNREWQLEYARRMRVKYRTLKIQRIKEKYEKQNLESKM